MSPYSQPVERTSGMPRSGSGSEPHYTRLDLLQQLCALLELLRIGSVRAVLLERRFSSLLVALVYHVEALVVARPARPPQVFAPIERASDGSSSAAAASGKAGQNRDDWLRVLKVEPISIITDALKELLRAASFPVRNYNWLALHDASTCTASLESIVR